ncbi:TPA: hypothetical protein JZG77_004168 [Escherichia coli]|nr:hypothetical protein [Escherichia coli]
MEKKSPSMPGINQCQQYKWRYRLRDVLAVLNNHPFLGVFLIFLGIKFLSIKRKYEEPAKSKKEPHQKKNRQNGGK